MKTRLHSALTYSNVVSTIALFAVVGGVSYAAVALPRNSVGTPQVRPGAITPPKLAFSLGMAHSTTSTTTVESFGCPPGAPCPPPAARPVTTTRLRLKPGSKVLLLGSATFSRADGSGGDPIEIDLGTAVRGYVDFADSGRLEGAERVRLRFWRVVAVPAGRGRARRHIFNLLAQAVAENNSDARVNVDDAQLIATVLPPAR
jgi:hypothetical protein